MSGQHIEMIPCCITHYHLQLTEALTVNSMSLHFLNAQHFYTSTSYVKSFNDLKSELKF